MDMATWPPERPCLVPGYERYRLVPDGIRREGGQGIVFPAQEGGERLAVKFFKESAWGNHPDLLDLFLQEARAGIRHRSDYLGHAYEVLDLRKYQARGWPPLAIVMEYFALSLPQLLADCRDKGFRLPLNLVERWTRQLAEACRALHAERWVHRDVKPGNILFRWPRDKTYGTPESLKHATAVLTDLGTLVREGQERRVPVLRDAWKDPLYFRARGETGEPERRLEVASDIYALGKVFEALLPYIEGPSEWLARIAVKCQDDPAKRPTAVDLLQSLSANADERIRAAEHAGWHLGQHAQFIGREWVREELNRFIRQCVDDDHGGVFLVVGPAGVGKSALLTNWAAAGAPWPGYYFNFRERDAVTLMPEHIYQQVRQQLPAEYHKPEADRWGTKDFEEMLRAWCRGNPSGRLLIFIDALDEAEDPGLAARLIPKDPPRGVFLIVSSRPAPTRDDHLGMLRCDRLKSLELLPEDEKNREDMDRYFRTRLEDYLDEPGQARQLTDAAAGIFRLAVLLANEVRSGKETVADVVRRAAESWGQLPAGSKLFGYYQDDLQRVLDEDLEPYFNDFARLVVAIQDWSSEDEILRVLQHDPPAGLAWHETQRDRLIRSLGWFLRSQHRQRDGDEATVCYWPQHASVRDFLLSDTPKFRGPARTGVREMHSRIGNCFRQLARDVGWERVPYYGRLHAARHLLQSERKDDYRSAVKELLCNPAYLHATLGDEPLESAGRAQPSN
jgi:serine/threonine protein kinase